MGAADIDDEVESKGEDESDCMREGAPRTRTPSSKASGKVVVDLGDAPHFASATSSSARRVSSSSRRQRTPTSMHELGHAKSRAHADSHASARSASVVEMSDTFLVAATTTTTTTTTASEAAEAAKAVAAAEVAAAAAAAEEQEAVLYVDVQLRSGCHRIAIYPDDDVGKVASRFCAINGVSAAAEEELFLHLCHLLADSCY